MLHNETLTGEISDACVAVADATENRLQCITSWEVGEIAVCSHLAVSISAEIATIVTLKCTRKIAAVSSLPLAEAGEQDMVVGVVGDVIGR